MQTEDQLSKPAYLDIVRAAAKPQPDLAERLEELDRILGGEEETERLRDMAKSFGGVDVSKGYVGISVIVPLKAIHSLLASDFKIGNWHYDRKAECLLVNLRRGRHERLSAVLHQIYVNTDNNTETAAEKFIDEGLGWFKSSASYGRMLLGDGVRLTAQEKAAFASVAAYET
jgi:hypothetical protein